jgi:hypothetical protein
LLEFIHWWFSRLLNRYFIPKTGNAAYFVLFCVFFTENSPALFLRIVKICSNWRQGEPSHPNLAMNTAPLLFLLLLALAGVGTGWSADAEPLAALQWHHGEAQDRLTTDGYTTPPEFHEKCFRQLALQDATLTAVFLPAVSDTENRLSAVGAMIAVAQQKGKLSAMLNALGKTGDSPPAELAVLNHRVVNAVGAAEWTAKATDAAQRKLLNQEFGLPEVSAT